MGDQLSGQFKTRPPENIIKAFLDHVGETGEPETFQHVCTSPAPRDIVPVLLKLFIAPRKKRPDGDMVPCPICSPNDPQFLEGYLAWYPIEGVLRAIGTRCGLRYLDEDDFIAARNRLKHEEKKKRLEDFALRNVIRVPQMITAAAALYGPAREAHRIHKKFRTEAPKTHFQLHNIARKNSGSLSVTIEKKSTKGGPAGIRTSFPGGREYVDISIGSLDGLTALLNTFNPEKKVQILCELLSVISRGEGEGAQLAICDLDFAGLERWGRNLSKSEAMYGSITESLLDFGRFFSASNFRILNDWGTHEAGPFRLEAHAKRTNFSLRHAFNDLVTIDVDREALAISNEWPGANELMAA